MSTDTKHSIDELIQLLQQVRDRDLVPVEKIDSIQDQINQLKKDLKHSTSPTTARRPSPGFGKHLIGHIAEDFDAPIEDMQDYMN